MASIKKISLETIDSNSNQTTTTAKSSLFFPIIAVIIIIGLGLGYFLARYRLQSTTSLTKETTKLTQNPTDSASIKVGDVFGSSDEKSFSDSAIGVIKAGGIDGEGSHHLERGANKSQWVYLTSSIVDLDLFIDTKVEIWGETFQAKKAGWLMDVGRIKVLGLNASTSTDSE